MLDENPVEPVQKIYSTGGNCGWIQIPSCNSQRVVSSERGPMTAALVIQITPDLDYCVQSQGSRASILWMG